MFPDGYTKIDKVGGSRPLPGTRFQSRWGMGEARLLAWVRRSKNPKAGDRGAVQALILENGLTKVIRYRRLKGRYKMLPCGRCGGRGWVRGYVYLRTHTGEMRVPCERRCGCNVRKDDV